MQYDFTSLIDRRGKDAIAVDVLCGGEGFGFAPKAPEAGFDPIPMWVADMNFPCLPDIQEKMIERIQHPTFGYFAIRDEYYHAIIQWQNVRNGVENLTKADIGYENGVLGGVASTVNALCTQGESILLHSPTYIGFTNILKANGYNMVLSPLVKDENGVWRMDYADMEKKLRDGHIHMTVFCSPHNPCGRVWERWEIEKAMELFEKYDVTVISDEIWSDLILSGKHIPTQSVSKWAREHTAALYAPSKTFNLAGLIGSYHIIYNNALRDRVRRAASLSHYNSINVLSMYALMGAYSDHGMEWTDQLLNVLRENVDYACDYISRNFHGVSYMKPQGTYMLFVDCTEWCAVHGKTIDDVEKAAWRVGCAVQDGRDFHGQCHLRINLALPKSRVVEAFDRLNRYVFNAE